MKVLFIGGTGVISSACTQLCVEMGMDLHLLNRGQTKRAIPENVTTIRTDIRDKNEIKSLMAN